MPIYEFKCTGCDTRWEHDRSDAYSPKAKHKVHGEPCGKIVRVWAVNINKDNLKAARG